MRSTEKGAAAAGPALGRRAVLLSGAAVVTLTGCSLNNPFSTEQIPATEAVRDLAPDVAVAIEAVTLLVAAASALAATTAAYPALAGRLASLAAAHQAHLDALTAAVPDRVDVSADPAPYEVPASRSAALASVRTSEAVLQDRLVALALRAESGAFARLLGSMSAAVAQRLVVLAR